MQWMGRRESDNVEEGSGGGGGRMAVGGGIVGIIGLIIYMFTGVNPTQMLNGGTDQGQGQQQNQRVTQDENDQMKFSRVVLADTEDIWNKLFSDMGQSYKEPILHFYSGGVNTEGCGFAQSATGPFYCPGDQKVYLDLSFFDELQNKLGASGEFARAYVIAHEVGHHVQDLLGTTNKVEQAEQNMSDEERNRMSVKVELQADFYAGVWAHYEQSMKGVINQQDIESALSAASAVGDDRLQQETQGRVEPDSFTHGTSAQRMYWFKKGYETGDIRQGNTFSDSSL
ncbi:zinc metallopeptidase [Mucilaginibacter robiniae]|uniref:Zinc metallopeptidase n=1 Tax=Mucilaginibacter robiniae TaxID=2728022 RepID=A0A7L5DYN4_9SPHI|nr:neutral zinc metallopeptidase [Mucilaginibacter robiniae]QJD95891.1 zinc metallopeptidase [Mucilaginibacter robiniae]